MLNQFIGGWQVAGIGNLRSTYGTVTTSYWVPTGAQLEYYGYKYPSRIAHRQLLPGLSLVQRIHSRQQINSHDANESPTA